MSTSTALLIVDFIFLDWKLITVGDVRSTSELGKEKDPWKLLLIICQFYLIIFDMMEKVFTGLDVLRSLVFTLFFLSLIIIIMLGPLITLCFKFSAQPLNYYISHSKN